MAITGSTRMQATSIQLCVMLTVLEMVVQRVEQGRSRRRMTPSPMVPEQFLAGLEELHATCNHPNCLRNWRHWSRWRNRFIAPGTGTIISPTGLGIDVLTDTTERSPTYCTPPFRKAGDTTAAESWAFLVSAADKNPGRLAAYFKARPALRGMETTMHECGNA